MTDEIFKAFEKSCKDRAKELEPYWTNGGKWPDNENKSKLVIEVDDKQFQVFQERVRQVREDLERIAQLSGTQLVLSNQNEFFDARHLMQVIKP